MMPNYTPPLFQNDCVSPGKWFRRRLFPGKPGPWGRAVRSAVCVGIFARLDGNQGPKCLMWRFPVVAAQNRALLYGRCDPPFEALY